MEEKFLCVMAEYDEESQKVLSNYQKKLFEMGLRGTQTPNLKHHITLGTFSTDAELFLVNQLKEIEDKFFKFDIVLNNLGLFGNEVLFIAPSTNYKLLDLENEFNVTGDKNAPFVAHTTMLTDNKDNIMKGIDILTDIFKRFTAKISTVSLYEFYPNKLIKRIELR